MFVQREPRFYKRIWFQWIALTTAAWFLAAVIMAATDLVVGIGLVGLVQAMCLANRIDKPVWWALSTILGWAICLLMLALVPPSILVDEGISVTESLLLYGSLSLVMLVVGVIQWLILRRTVEHSGWWIPAHAIGFLPSAYVFVLLRESPPELSIAVFGFINGVVTSLFLIRLFRESNERV